MMTSRSEFRLLLRQDNADRRLTELGHEIGLISEERYAKFKEKQSLIEKEEERLTSTVLSPTAELNEILEKAGETPVRTGLRLAEAIRRPTVTYEMLAPVDKNRPSLPDDVIFTAVTDIKYDGYIKKQLAEAEKFEKLEKRLLPPETDFLKIRGLSTEAAQKLDAHKPASIGEASRISGVSPADIAVLLIYLDSISSDRRRGGKREENK